MTKFSRSLITYRITSQWITVGVTVIGWPVCAYLGYWWGSKRERVRRAKDNFLAVLAEQRAKFDEMRLQEGQFFEQSVPVLTRAVYGIQHFLPASQRKCLHAVLKEYQSHHKSEFEGIAVLAAVFSAEQGTGKTVHQTLQDFIDRFERCVHEST